MPSPYEVVRQQQAILAALAEVHAAASSPTWTRALVAAADELLDPDQLPELLALSDPRLHHPSASIDAAILALREVIPDVDAATALACARSVRHLADAQTAGAT